MKTRSKLAMLCLILAGSLGAGLEQANAQLAYSAGLQINVAADFYNPLAPYGVWVDVGSYGRCWRPGHVSAGWRPYCNGSWEWTDCGWYWQSDEPWAWACYHFGYWDFDPTYGWVWIPGTEWAPAWVVWRDSPDYIGWAPCGPGGAVPAPSLFVFVGAHHFHDRIRPDSVLVNNLSVVKQTRVVNHFTRVTRDFAGTPRRIAFNSGPSIKLVQRATGTKFTPRPINEVATQTPAPSFLGRRTETRHLERATPAPPSHSGREPVAPPGSRGEGFQHNERGPHQPGKVQPAQHGPPQNVPPEQEKDKHDHADGR